ncbi:MAG TPA: DEAD/DEAH box helicase [Chryseosolibacter sp.]
MSFEKLELIDPIRAALKAEGYTQPTPIQERSIPIILSRKDLLGCAQTGTGKTAAFAIPILQLLHQDELYKKGPAGIKSLILTPTRELAIQIGESFAAYGKFLKLKHTVIFGGVSQKAQTDALRAGVDILIATPGRLLDLIDQRYINLQHLKIFVLDEADRMLDMGFIHDVKKVIAKIPAKRQTLFFSATMPDEIKKLSSSILTNPERVEVTPVSSTAEKVTQGVYFVEKNDKKKLLLHVLKEKAITSTLVFTRTKHGADRVAKDLSKLGITAMAIHGNKSQNARQNALKAFKDGKLRVLVATDIAARGIDIDELSFVINYEIPNVPETYVHRIGRTGRAGASGIAISFCDDEERDFLKDIQKLIGKQVPVITDNPYPMNEMPSHQRELHKVPNTPGRHPNNNGQRRNATNGSRPKNSGRRNNANQDARNATTASPENRGTNHRGNNNGNKKKGWLDKRGAQTTGNTVPNKGNRNGGSFDGLNFDIKNY